jgi:CHASE2 domain-containing sensor protein
MQRRLRRGRRRAALLAARIRPRLRYWVTALAILFAVSWGTPYVEASLNLAPVRSWLFQHLAGSVTNPARFRDVRLVLIRDDEYWGGAPHHRVPIDRAYLAALVNALDTADAAVIALDFDVPLPEPLAGGPLQPGDYQAVDSYAPYRAEADVLARAIANVATRRKIVLAKSIKGPIDGPFELQDDIYQAYGLCNRLVADGTWDNPGTPAFPLTPQARANISCGYIALMVDKRRVPPPRPIVGQAGWLDSFPLAIIRARRTPGEPGPSFHHQDYYASYVPPERANQPYYVVSAHDLLSDPAAQRATLQGRPVIVGGAWHLRAAGSGRLVDVHDTPVGQVSGALLHQNMAEAVESDRIYPALPEAWVTVLELLFGLAAAIIFAALATLWRKVGAIVAAMLLLFVVQWVTLQLLGTFFDAFVIVLGLGLHAIIDRLIGEPEAAPAEAPGGSTT